ncbi:hypothetical protein QVD17_00047 [Tagetes erecta]|uniref:Uncharacterized protein n=1 Tax=Tagetes erecta TaxID=13708 RepID=A0AAD8P0A2_TARER|nr:hypothetical protein QVD17_00047 [Tagetes erecta]
MSRSMKLSISFPTKSISRHISRSMKLSMSLFQPNRHFLVASVLMVVLGFRRCESPTHCIAMLLLTTENCCLEMVTKTVVPNLHHVKLPPNPAAQDGGCFCVSIFHPSRGVQVVAVIVLSITQNCTHGRSPAGLIYVTRLKKKHLKEEDEIDGDEEIIYKICNVIPVMFIIGFDRIVQGQAVDIVEIYHISSKIWQLDNEGVRYLHAHQPFGTVLASMELHFWELDVLGLGTYEKGKYLTSMNIPMGTCCILNIPIMLDVAPTIEVPVEEEKIKNNQLNDTLVKEEGI